MIRFFSVFFLVSGLALNAIAAEQQDATPAPIDANKPIKEEIKALTNKDIFNKIKTNIKPVEIKEEAGTISIIRSAPRKTLKSDDGSAKGKNLDIKLNDVDEKDISSLIKSAYKAAMLGQIEVALVLYKKALEKEPDNTNVLFALASLYHKLSQTKEAKIYYKKLLQLDPNYQKALNNYIVLMSEESPSQALMELKELEKANPEFTPVVAQIGMVYAKLGEYETAEQYLKRSVILSPEIINYRYNLAVIYDNQKKYPEAVSVYKQLLDSSLDGSSLPQSLFSIKSRMTYLQEKIALQRQ